MNTQSEHLSLEVTHSKLGTYALNQYMTSERINATSDEIIGILNIRIEDKD